MADVAQQRKKQTELESVRRDLDNMAERRLLRAFDENELVVYCSLLHRETQLLSEARSQ